MSKRQRVLVAVCAFFVCVAATQFAMRGVHGPSGNTGWLGSDLAGVEGRGALAAVYGLNTSNNFSGILGSSIAGVRALNATGSTDARLGTSTNAIYGIATCSGCQAIYGSTSSDARTAILGVGDGWATGKGVSGQSDIGYGVAGWTNHGTAIFGELNPGGGGHAGWFEGRVHVNGTLTKSAGTFRIDHPLDPANKYLSHSFVESPDMKNIYDGVVTLEADGSAVVELPEWFEALNRDFRYQLTCIGENAPIYIAEKIKGNRFRIAGGYAGMEVSWQVTGSRNDVYAKAYPTAVEEVKPAHEAGRFLHPELYAAPLNQRVKQAPPIK